MIPLACGDDGMIFVFCYVEGKRPLVECSVHFFWFGLLLRERLSEPIEPLQSGAEESEGSL